MITYSAIALSNREGTLSNHHSWKIFGNGQNTKEKKGKKHRKDMDSLWAIFKKLVLPACQKFILLLPRTKYVKMSNQ